MVELPELLFNISPNYMSVNNCCSNLKLWSKIYFIILKSLFHSKVGFNLSNQISPCSLFRKGIRSHLLIWTTARLVLAELAKDLIFITIQLNIKDMRLVFYGKSLTQWGGGGSKCWIMTSFMNAAWLIFPPARNFILSHSFTQKGNFPWHVLICWCHWVCNNKDKYML